MTYALTSTQAQHYRFGEPLAYASSAAPIVAVVLFLQQGVAPIQPLAPPSSAPYAQTEKLALDALGHFFEWFAKADYARQIVSAPTLARTVAFFRGMSSFVEFPHIGASDDGDIGLTWYRGANRFSVMIDDSGMAWTQKLAGEYVPGYDIDASDSVAFEPVYKSLAEFYGVNRALSL